MLDSDVTIEGETSTGAGRPKVKIALVGETDPDIIKDKGAFLLPGSKNVSFRNFDIDANACTSAGRLFIMSGTSPGNIHLSNINVDNGNSDIPTPRTQGNFTADCDFYFISSTNSNGLYIHNIKVTHMKNGVRLHTRSKGIQKNIYIQNNLFEKYYIGAIRFDDASDKTYIENNEFTYHALSAWGTSPSNEGHPKNSNPVVFQPYKFSQSAPPHTNVYVRHNTFTGREETTASDPGGSGDLLGLRGTRGFVVEHNEFFEAGEVGLTATAGLEEGVIRYNTIHRADFSGIQVGNPTPGYRPVAGVSVYGNTVLNAGADKDDRVGNGLYALPGIALYNIDGVCVVNNIINTPDDTGIWLHDATSGNTNPRFGPQSGKVYISHNTVSGSEKASRGPDQGKELNYSQSGIPLTIGAPTNSDYPELMEFYRQGLTTGFYNGTYGSSVGQGPWVYGSAALASAEIVDNDDDGLHSGCYDETNDNDPCIPDETAAACRL